MDFDSWQIPIPAEYPEDLAFALSLPQVFKYPGGKHQVAHKIAKMLPPHLTYVEPFCGSAAVFWAKDPAPTEVLNDLRRNLVDTFRWIRDTDSFDPLFKMNWNASKTRHQFLRKWKPKSAIGKAYRFLWIARASMMNREGEGYSPVIAKLHLGSPPQKSRFPKWKDRLQGVTLLARDAYDVIPEFDSPHTAFYVDPPYPEGRHANLYKDNEMTMEGVERLFEVLNHCQGKWLVSLNSASLPKKLGKGVHVRKIKLMYGFMPTSVKGKDVGREPHNRMEVLVHNYDIH